VTRPDLTEVATYCRRVGVGIERVWENVLDWEHLPWLHRSSFASIDLIEMRGDGWRARIGLQSGAESQFAEIDLRTERERRRYLTATVAGVGAGTEIWTALDPVAARETAVAVRFCLPDVAPEHITPMGDFYRALYARLWDEDEAMMLRRDQLSGRPRARAAAAALDLDLGSRRDVLDRAPFVVELGGRSYRVVAVDGEIMAHACVCPHALGPLDEGELNGACVRCPWHGYEFDIRDGRRVDGAASRGNGGGDLRLGPIPTVAIEGEMVYLRVGG